MSRGVTPSASENSRTVAPSVKRTAFRFGSELLRQRQQPLRPAFSFEFDRCDSLISSAARALSSTTGISCCGCSSGNDSFLEQFMNTRRSGFFFVKNRSFKSLLLGLEISSCGLRFEPASTSGALFHRRSKRRLLLFRGFDDFNCPFRRSFHLRKIFITNFFRYFDADRI
jgi:hypothetical protein